MFFAEVVVGVLMDARVFVILLEILGVTNKPKGTVYISLV